MNTNEQSNLFNLCFKYLFNNQLNEINNIRTTDVNERKKIIDNIVDDQEKWIIDNCTPLFFIEKATDIIQEYISNFNIEKMLIEIIEYYKKDGITIYETSNDGPNALRIVNLKKIQFATLDKLIIDEKYYKNINNIVNSILGKSGDGNDKNVDFTKGQELVFSLTLSFGEYGGHFALIFCKYENSEWQIGIVDPYKNTYIDAFKTIVKDIFKTITEREPSNFKNKINMKIGSGIQELSYVESSAPKTLLEKYNVQTSNNQDHFCFMWCVYFFENFLIYRWQNTSNFQSSIISVIKDVNDISNEIFVKKLQIIKSYIIGLKNKNIIELSGYTKLFFEKYFPCIWYDNTVNNSNIITKAIFNKNLYNYKNFSLHKIENNILVEIDPIDYLYTPTVFVKNVMYRFKTDEAKNIFNSLSLVTVTKFNLFNNDNIIKIFYCRLYETISTNAYQRNVVIPLNYYNMKTTSNNLNYFDNNDININISNTRLGCTDEEATEIGKLLNLKDFSCSYDTYINRRQCDNKIPAKTCGTLMKQIQNRNDVFNNTRFRCKLKDNNLSLEPYQETVYKVMKQKIENSLILNRTQNPGLLVWFGTGTGKTLAASIVAKMFGYCMNFSVIDKVIIISPKSAFTNFKKELEQRLNIMMNKFLKDDNLSKKNIEDSFYFHGKNTNIYLFTHPIFTDLFMNDTGKVNNDSNSFFNNLFLENALLIVDECHNFTAYGVDGPKKSTIFMSDCCKNAKQVLLLTATPIVNTPFDLEILLSYLDARDIGNNKSFTTDYFGKFDKPFFKVNNKVINIDENNLSLVETFTSPRIWGDTNNKIGIIPSKKDIYINKIRNPIKTSSEIKDYFSNRILYYMTEDENPSPLPDYNEKINYIFWNTENEYKNYVRLFLENKKLLQGNKEKENTNAFNSQENNYIWKDTDIMLNSVLNIIKTRESLLPDKEINNIPITNTINLKNKFRTNSYKYIIFCNYKENIDSLEKFLSKHIDRQYIGIIRGDTSAEDRKNIASKYDEGYIKIVILSKAGEEGVDFKRTGVIILADGVWTSAEYDQILGRAVRKNSNLRLNITIDINTIIPDKIECISLLLSSKYKSSDTETKYSGDLRQFKIILNKRAIIKQVTEDIKPYFFKIMDRRDMVTFEDEIGFNETFNDGKSKRHARSRSKRRVRSRSKKRARSRSKRRVRSRSKLRRIKSKKN